MSSLSIHSVRKSFGATRVISNVSLEIASGEFFFLLGPSGCGKSTLLRIIAGLERADSGEVLIDGVRVDDVPPQRRGIGMVFQNYALWPHMTVAQNISFGLENLPLSRQDRVARLSEALETVQMGGFADRYPHQISGGQQQRVALARALALKPKIILLDEPLSNLDAKLRVEIRDELASLHRTLRATMIYVTHDQEDALTLASRIAIMNGGVIEQVGSATEIYERPSSRFVASFLGQANLLPCSARPTTSGTLQIELEGVGSQPFDLSQQLSTERSSARGYLCVRPEALKIAVGPQPAALHATLTRKSYKGPSFELELTLENKLRLLALVPTGHAVAAASEGQPVSVAWAPTDARFLVG